MLTAWDKRRAVSNLSPQRCSTLVTDRPAPPMSACDSMSTTARSKLLRAEVLARVIASRRKARVATTLLGPQSMNSVATESEA